MANRKLLLAKVRNGNYAHAGEEEAIEIAMNHVPKNPNQLLLDVGAGLGGTAAYLNHHGWGNVVGIDIDSEMISQARNFYPDLEFHQADALKISDYFTQLKFDVIYSFNAFFSFENQEKCLQELRKVANQNATLILFDYSSQNHFSEINLFYDSKITHTPKLFNPINLSKIENQLEQTEWKLKKLIDLTSQYELWYQTLMAKMQQQRTELVALFGQETFDDLYEGYRRLYVLIKDKVIGGVVVLAGA